MICRYSSMNRKSKQKNYNCWNILLIFTNGSKNLIRIIFSEGRIIVIFTQNRPFFSFLYFLKQNHDLLYLHFWFYVYIYWFLLFCFWMFVLIFNTFVYVSFVWFSTRLFDLVKSLVSRRGRFIQILRN